MKQISLHDILISILTAFFMTSLHAADIIPGDAQGFSFPILRNAFYPAGGIFFVGAAVAGAGKEFSIAGADNGTSQFIGFTPQVTSLNNKENQPNPLYGAFIDKLALLDRRPVAVTQADDTTLYLINDLQKFSVLSATDFHDVTGTSTAQHIVGITTDADGSERTTGNGIFVALSPVSNTFGAPGSGIGFAQQQSISVILDQQSKAEKIIPYLSILNTNDPNAGWNRATPLDATSDAVTIGASLASINNSVVDMHWDEDLARLYIALQITTSAGVGNGGKAIATARYDHGHIIVESITENSAITNNSIIAAQNNAGTDISIHKVRTMFTTTRLHYLIVVGGIGASAATRNRVFALPLVNTQPYNATTGLLAKKDSSPATIFSPVNPQRFVNRILPIPATAPGDIPSSTDPEAIIGTGPAPGDISAISVIGDAVFVSTATVSGNQQPGIFHSQALFNADGTIKEWSPWRQVAGVAATMVGFALDPFMGNFWYMPQSGSTATMVLRTKWQAGNTPLSTALNTVFSAVRDGIQGFVDFPKETLGFNQIPGLRLSLAAATGYRAIELIQTGADDASNRFGPVADFSSTFNSTDGTLAGFTPPINVITARGGVLDELGPIVSSAIITDNAQSWLVVGGSYGVAVLAHEDGTGAAGGLTDGFGSFDATMRFKKIGNYTNVVKIIGAGTNLYVLTPARLDRIAASTTNFATGATVALANLATPEALPGHLYFLDSLISEPFGLLGTTGGLIRVGNGRDISTASAPAAVDWTPVVIPESAGAVSKIFALSPTALQQDAAFGGNVYILNSSVSNHISRIYRYSLDVDIVDPIDNNSITLFDDTFVRGINSFFFNVGNYRNNVATDGAVIFLTRSKYGLSLPFVQLVRRNLRFADLPSMQGSQIVVAAQEQVSLFNVVRNSGSGSWIVPGNFGVYTNE